MTSRVVLLAFLACVLAQLGARPAAAETEGRAPIHYLGRADARLCPSPMCGGLWLKPLNGVKPACAEPVGGKCYVTGLSFKNPAPSPDETTQERLNDLVARGGGLVLGHMTLSDVEGYPDLRALNVVRIWQPVSSRKPRGLLWVLQDNGLRCVTHPCSSTRAAAVDTNRFADVSDVDLSSTGAGPGELRFARTRIATRHQLATGFVRRRGAEKVFVASQLYFAARTG